MPEPQLTAGTISYEDTSGPGPVLVLLGGVVTLIRCDQPEAFARAVREFVRADPAKARLRTLWTSSGIGDRSRQPLCRTADLQVCDESATLRVGPVGGASTPLAGRSWREMSRADSEKGPSGGGRGLVPNQRSAS